MKRTLITIALTTLVVLTLVGVITSVFSPRIGSTFNLVSDDLPGGYGGGQPDFYAPAMEMPAPAPMVAESFVRDSGYDYSYEEVVASAASVERLVIQNVDMSIVVADPETRMNEIADMAVQMGGFVVSSNLYRSTYGPNEIEVPEGSMTVRVPAQKLDEALASIKADVVEVMYENRSGEDITDQYVNLQSRLKAKQDAEKKLLEIMDTAEKAEDVLAIYLQVQNIQTEIEVLQGQIKYYEESAALSAISIRLVADETVQPIEIGGWKLQGTAKRAIENLGVFMKGFTEFLINFFLDYLWRIVAVVLPIFAVFLGGRALFRRFRKPKAVVEVKEEKK